MIKNTKELKKERSDLVELFEGMSREELLKQCYLECIDAINMEERVQLFMNECTINTSKTNYTIDILKSLISDKQDQDIKEWCVGIIEDSDGDNDYILNEVKEQASLIDS